MQNVVIDGDNWLSPRFRDIFVGNHLGYNVTNCRMLRMNLLYETELAKSFLSIDRFGLVLLAVNLYLGFICAGYLLPMNLLC